MKKYKYLLVALALIIASLSGCKKDEDLNEFEFEYVDEGTEANVSDDKSKEATDSLDTTNNSVEIGTIDTYVGSVYKKTDTISVGYEPEEMYEIEVNLDVPEIKDDSDAAKTINSEIYDMAKDSINQIEALIDKTAEEKYEPPYSKISYEAYLNGEILSIIVKYDAAYYEWTDYAVFNYDVVNKQLVDNASILEAAGVSKEQFIKMAKQSFGEIALPDIEDFVNGDTNNTSGLIDEQELSEDESEDNADEEELFNEEWRGSIVADYIRDYVETVSDKNINADMPVYLDGNGELNAVALVMVPAGAGQYYNVAKIEEKSNDAMIKKYCEYADMFNYDGFEKQLLALYELEGYSGSIIRKITVSNMRSEDVYLGFDDNDTSLFLMQFSGDDFADAYVGKLEFDSFDENGIIFKYVLDSKNGEPLDESHEEAENETEQIHSGRFYLNPYSVWDENEESYISGVIYKHIDGEDMLGSNGTAVDLRKSFG